MREFAIGQYVIAKYENSYYHGELLQVPIGFHTMEQSGPKFWKWPSSEDVLEYAIKNITKTIKPPTVVSHHGTFSVIELDYV